MDKFWISAIESYRNSKGQNYEFLRLQAETSNAAYYLILMVIFSYDDAHEFNNPLRWRMRLMLKMGALCH